METKASQPLLQAFQCFTTPSGVVLQALLCGTAVLEIFMQGIQSREVLQ